MTASSTAVPHARATREYGPRLRRAPHARAVVVVAFLCGVIGGQACATPSVQFEVDLPQAISADVKWVEVAAFAGRCPTGEQLVGGLPQIGASKRVAFAAGSPAPSIGALGSGAYGFAAVARGADCGVLSAGCTVVDVTTARDVHVVTRAVATNPATACRSNEVCSGARCVPPVGVDDPSFGANCSMQLVGAGPFANAQEVEQLQVSMPTVIPAGDGFVIGYTEFSQLDGTMQLTLLPISQDGAVLPLPSPTAINGHCKGAFGDDATALAPGLAVVSRPPCASKSGVELFPLSSTGAVTARNMVLAPQPPGPAMQLSTRSLASVNATLWVLALRVDGTSVLELSNGATVSASKSFGKPSDTGVHVARSSGVQIVSVDGAGVNLGDAGVPSGSQARVHLTASMGDPIGLTTPDDQLPANLSAVAALGTRAFVITDGGGKSTDLVMRAYDFGVKDAPLDIGFGLANGTGPVLSLDAIGGSDRLFVTAARARTIVIEVLDHATSSTPAFLREVVLSDDLRIPQAYVDGSVAIAVTKSRVAVAWSNRRALLPFGEPAGSYAVFACR